jgi:hypothetical protein
MLVAARVVEPAAKLATARQLSEATAAHSLGTDLHPHKSTSFEAELRLRTVGRNHLQLAHMRARHLRANKSNHHSSALKVERGEIEDETFLPVLYQAPHDCDWQDEAVWQAGPLRRFTSFQTMERKKMKYVGVVSPAGLLLIVSHQSGMAQTTDDSLPSRGTVQEPQTVPPPRAEQIINEQTIKKAIRPEARTAPAVQPRRDGLLGIRPEARTAPVVQPRYAAPPSPNFSFVG